MNKESKKNQPFEQASVQIQRYAPGHPPKNYNRKKAISIFGCLYFSYGFRCPELLRATITSAGDVYIIPLHRVYLAESEKGRRDFHISYHKSREFHWTHGGTHIVPVCGEDDAPAAMRLWLKLKQPPCFCFRKGRNLNDEEIVTLIQHLAQNLPFNFNVEEASQNLKNAKFYRMVVREHV